MRVIGDRAEGFSIDRSINVYLRVICGLFAGVVVGVVEWWRFWL